MMNLVITGTLLVIKKSFLFRLHGKIKKYSSFLMPSVSAQISRQFGLSPSVHIIAGTTDGCASFLATGASEIGDAVTALGSTVTIKLLSDKPVFAPEYGVYSHLIGDKWLAGGASNSGGKALEQYFSKEMLSLLSSEIDPDTESGCDFYPLPAKG